MIHQNYVMRILLENALSFDKRTEIHSLMESEMDSVNNTMVSNLYKSAIEKSHIDFDDIPESKGDITRYSGYSSMVEVIALLKGIAAKGNTKIAELETVETAIANIVTYRDLFERGFKFEKEFIILQYNVLVYACVEAVSNIISSYVDFVKRPDRVEFTIIKDKHRPGNICIQNLEKFNLSVKQGDFSKVLTNVIGAGKEGFVGIDDIIIPAIIIGGIMLIVPLIRELTFLFYYSRMRLSDYLGQQATLLEINKQNVTNANGVPAKKKAEIVKNQEKLIQKLHSLSDKIKVDRATSENKASVELKKENSGWTIDDVKSQSASTDEGGFQLL